MVTHRRYTLVRMRWHLSMQTAALHVRLHRVHLFLPVPVQFAALFWYCSTSRKSTEHAENVNRSPVAGPSSKPRSPPVTSLTFHLRARSDDMKIDRELSKSPVIITTNCKTLRKNAGVHVSWSPVCDQSITRSRGRIGRTMWQPRTTIPCYDDLCITSYKQSSFCATPESSREYRS